MDDVFEILVREYHQMVFAYLMALVNDPHVAEDLTQETFLVAHRRMPDYDRSRDFGSWVRGIARNLALAQHRRAKRFRFVQLEEVEEQLAGEFAREGQAAPDFWQRRTAALRACLEKADDILRNMLQWHYAERLTAGDIAERLGLGVEAVWKRISRGRMALRHCVERTLGRGDLGA